MIDETVALDGIFNICPYMSDIVIVVIIISNKDKNYTFMIILNIWKLVTQMFIIWWPSVSTNQYWKLDT